jgi:hypothetical protein
MGVRGSLLSPVRLERLASAFELSEPEVLVDAKAILGWTGEPGDLEALLNARHAWRSDEAFYFIRWVRLETWCTQNRVPDQRSSLLSDL